MSQNSRIDKDTVLYIEEFRGSAFGTLHNIRTGNKAYLNEDMLATVLHFLEGRSVESFFPQDLEPELRKSLIVQVEHSIGELTSCGFVKNNDGDGGYVKTVRTAPPLRVLFIETTKRCNLRCAHCYVTDCFKPTKTELSAVELRNLITQADDLGIMELQLTGGEFFLSPEYLEILKLVGHKLIPCSVFTNGTVINEEAIEYLKMRPHGWIFYISLDGPEAIHDSFRGSVGAYKKTVSTIKKLLGLGCDVRINTSVNGQNINYMNDFVTFVEKEFGVIHRLSSVDPVGRAAGRQDLLVGGEELSGLLAKDGKEFKFLDSHDLLSSGEWETPACGVGIAMMFVDAYGNASLCPTLTQEQDPAFLAGNIRQESLKDIWEKSPVYSRYRQTQCREIDQCSFKESCRGGCRSKAFLSSGSLNAPDKQMCMIYGKTV